MAADPNIVVYYEHPHWFRPLFAELNRRGVPWHRAHAGSHRFDPGERRNSNGNGAPPTLVINRMSPSAWRRGGAALIPYPLHYLAWLEQIGADVFNGLAAFTFETSKALQVSLLSRLDLPVPRTRVVSDPGQLLDAARQLEFPVLVKPNVGGSGAGIAKFETAQQLRDVVQSGGLEQGPDETLLVQEYHRPEDNSIVRVETLEGRYLYGIRVHLNGGDGFDLCPADICKTVSGEALESAACPVEAQKTGLTVEPYEPPAAVVAAVERIAQGARLDAGGIEYLESARDGRLYFYDINALSNFVAEPERVIGFDPTARLVDALLARASGRQAGANGRRP